MTGTTHTRELAVLAAHGLAGDDARTAYQTYCNRRSTHTFANLHTWEPADLIHYFGADAARVASILTADWAQRLAVAVDLTNAGVTPTEDVVANVQTLASQAVNHRAAAEHWLAQAEAERTAGHRDPLSAQIAIAHALIALITRFKGAL